MTYKVLDDDLLMQETAWQIAIHLEHFNCKNNKLPCHDCRRTATKLAPLFLFSIDTIAKVVEHHPKALTTIVLDTIGKQKWQILRPWKQFSIPTPKSESDPLQSWFAPVQTPPKEAVTYKLVKRHKEESK